MQAPAAHAQALEDGLGGLEAGQSEGLRRLARDVADGLEDAEASLLVRAPASRRFTSRLPAPGCLAHQALTL